MAVICPTVTANNTHQYREQMERAAQLTKRIHIDFMDGLFAPTHSPSLAEAWWSEDVQADLHIMYQRPQEHTEALIKLKPSLVIVHAEADGNFVELAKALHQAGIKVGVALLAHTGVGVIAPALEYIDHVLIFSGNLGHYGGTADLKLLEKVQQCKDLKPSLEIGWDGGITNQNVQKLVEGGVDVLNVGGYIQRAEHPAKHFEQLQDLLQ